MNKTTLMLALTGALSCQVALSCHGALAADLPVRSEAPAPVYAAPAFTWTGFYVGAHAGYFTSSTKIRVPAFPIPDSSPRPNGFKAGALAGYRHQVGNLVFGVEADGSWMDRASKDALIPGAHGAWRLASGGWDASVRASAGYALNNFLVYATGGAAFTRVKGCGYNVPGPTDCVPGSQYANARNGWIAGLGVEYAINHSWSVRGEYLHAAYGTKSQPLLALRGENLLLRYATDTFRIGVNYRFGAPTGAVVAKY